MMVEFEDILLEANVDTSKLEELNECIKYSDHINTWISIYGVNSLQMESEQEVLFVKNELGTLGNYPYKIYEMDVRSRTQINLMLYAFLVMVTRSNLIERLTEDFIEKNGRLVAEFLENDVDRMQIYPPLIFKIVGDMLDWNYILKTIRRVDPFANDTFLEVVYECLSDMFELEQGRALSKLCDEDDFMYLLQSGFHFFEDSFLLQVIKGETTITQKSNKVTDFLTNVYQSDNLYDESLYADIPYISNSHITLLKSKLSEIKDDNILLYFEAN